MQFNADFWRYMDCVVGMIQCYILQVRVRNSLIHIMTKRSRWGNLRNHVTGGTYVSLALSVPDSADSQVTHTISLRTTVTQACTHIYVASHLNIYSAINCYVLLFLVLLIFSYTSTVIQ